MKVSVIVLVLLALMVGITLSGVSAAQHSSSLAVLAEDEADEVEEAVEEDETDSAEEEGEKPTLIELTRRLTALTNAVRKPLPPPGVVGKAVNTVKNKAMSAYHGAKAKSAAAQGTKLNEKAKGMSSADMPKGFGESVKSKIDATKHQNKADLYRNAGSNRVDAGAVKAESGMAAFGKRQVDNAAAQGIVVG